MQAFEQGIEDDESINEYLMCSKYIMSSYKNYEHLDRACYIWQLLIDRDGEYSQRARDQLTLYFGSSTFKRFPQLLKEATAVESTENDGSIIVESFCNSRSQALVGFCYHTGLGVEQNIAQAIHFYKLSRDPDILWDLLSCYKLELTNGTINIRDVLEFYKQNLNTDAYNEYYKITANLILANIYHNGIRGFVFPNLFKAYEYYAQAFRFIRNNREVS